jgi:aminopeptidase
MPLARFAELAVRFGCNLQPGQIVCVNAEVGCEEPVRAIAEAAYRHGAAYVDVTYDDAHVARSRLRHAADDTLDLVPSWRMARVRDLGAGRHASLYLSASRDPGFFAGIDPGGIARISMGAEFAAMQDVIRARLSNWSLLPFPTPAWAELVHPGLAPDRALAELTRQLIYVCRLDMPDPMAAWRERVAGLSDVAGRLTARRFDALRFNGPGTDLTIGLLPTSRFTSTYLQTAGGVWHMANLPSEEILTAPDPLRADGTVRATKPLYFGGVVIEDLEVEFASGRAVRIDGSSSVDALRAAVASHENGDRIGEVALVDASGRIGELATVFYNTLLDENAASHLALGNAYTFCVEPEERSRINRSEMHVDFMVGSNAMSVAGAVAGGGWEPILDGGKWRL